MLTHIFVKDLAIVSTLELPFDAGMSALTGETGAGKSILIDALGLALGDKTDNAMIRAECARAEIIAEFDVSDQPQALQWLSENDLDEGPSCIMRRLLTRDARSRAFINGRPAPIQQLQALGSLLVDIHGQHAHQSLLRASEQRRLLDEYAGAQALADRVAASHKDWRAAQVRLQQLKSAARDRLSRLELLSFQRDELELMALSLEELKQLDEDQRRLRNTGRLQEASARLLQALYDDEDSAIETRLSHALSDLDELIEFSSPLSEQRELIDSALIQIQEAAGGLRAFAEQLEMDPMRLQEVEQRLSDIHDVARKFRAKPEELPERLQHIRTELQDLEHADEELSELENTLQTHWQAYREQANKLSVQRQKAAKTLSKTVTDCMRTLGMGEGVFEIQLETLDEANAGASGIDKIEYQVSANPGQPLRPLAKVASGGELSRISLGIQVATAECGKIPTLIFDEVDVGIGGGVAQIVGRLLRSLGGQRQVLCVTHLPQVAAQAHHQLQVKKTIRKKQTHTGIVPLDDDERIDEIARMLGGVEITEKTLAHAREMLTAAID
jgi:DNA repair protein RecN (Recombination protein N)